jgi:cell division protein FtsB
VAAARKRRTHAGARGTIRWDRVGRLALLATLGVILLLYISPAKHWLEQSRTSTAQKQELQALNAENATLKRRLRGLRNPATLESEARRLGMVKEGERAYVIENPPK